MLRMSEIKDVPQDKADPVREGPVPPSALWRLFSPVFLAHPVRTTGKYQEQAGKHLGFKSHSTCGVPHLTQSRDVCISVNSTE